MVVFWNEINQNDNYKSKFNLTALSLHLNLIWSKEYLINITSEHPARSISIDKESSSLYLAGRQSSLINPQTSKGYLVKTDFSGNLIWQKTYDRSLANNAMEGFSSIKQSADGNLIVAGYTNKYITSTNGSFGPTQGWLLKLDAEGGKYFGSALYREILLLMKKLVKKI